MRSPNQPIGSNHPANVRMRDLISTIGRVGLNALHPDEFEYYTCSLELVDADDRVVDFFTFPIMPSQITQMEQSLTNIKQTLGGITAITTSVFTPITIQLSGDFGRRLKILLGTDYVDFAGIQASWKTGIASSPGEVTPKNLLSKDVKTGYGCIKIMQHIFRQSRALDDKQRPYKLYFYNPAIGDSFLVKPISLQVAQNKGNNMIWEYDLNLTAIAPIVGSKNQLSLNSTIGIDLLQKGVNALFTQVKQSLKLYS